MSSGAPLGPPSLYESLYKNLPGFAWRAKILGTAPWGGHRLSLEVVSDGCFAIFGIVPEKMLGANTIEQCTLPEDLGYVKQKTDVAIQSRLPVVFCYRILCADRRTVKWLREEARCLYGDDGSPQYLEGHITDATREKEQELQLRQENQRLEDLTGESDGRLGGMVGNSRSMRLLHEKIRLAARSDAAAIFYGETGAGKDLAARTLHLLSGRKGPFVPVNCGAIPESLMESEFFGHVKGAFSGAVSNQEGFIATADRGTLFLDEVGELPLAMQVKLLRVLEGKTYTPVGASKPRMSHFRLVCATNRRLDDLVAQGKMRPDFYYRVHVIAMDIPPLRERMEDIPLLIRSYFDKHGIQRTLSPSVNKRIMGYPWPGNIRELHNFLDRCLVFGEAEAESLGRQTPEEDSPVELGSCPTLADAVACAEKNAVATALQHCGGRLGQSAAMLGISLSTLKRKIRQHGLSRR